MGRLCAYTFLFVTVVVSSTAFAAKRETPKQCMYGCGVMKFGYDLCDALCYGKSKDQTGR